MITRGRGKKKVDVFCGFINWNEDFKDEATGDIVTIARRRVVRENNEWI